MKVKDTGNGIQLYDFSPAEAFKIARKLEREGIRFYDLLMKKAADPKAKEIVRYLRDGEAEHLRLFESLLEGGDQEALENDEEDLLDSIEDGVFAVPASEVYAADFDRALELGIIIEKRSLAFYLEVAKHTASREGKDALRKVIEEERQHWEELKKLAQ